MTHLDFDTGQQTLIGITAGALLATVGGILAGQIENRLRRRERQQSAALLFGEILAGLRLILRLANDARGRGDPYGPITIRTLQAAHRETQIYDRNRETLFDVRDATLRARTHLALMQISLTLEGIFEAHAAAIQAPAATEGAIAAAAGRESSFDFLMEFRPEIAELIARYEKLARQPFDAHDLVLQANGVRAVPAPPLASEA